MILPLKGKGLMASLQVSPWLSPMDVIDWLTFCTAAAIQQVTPALDFAKEDIAKMLDVNYTGVFLTARECARQMMKYKIEGSICLIASMSGTIANRGFLAPVYNSSKAAVVQLARNLAMEWGRKNEDGSGGIRVNSLSPGHIVTPMVQANFDAGEANREEWENNSMLGRLSQPEEYKAAGLFMLSKQLYDGTWSEDGRRHDCLVKRSLLVTGHVCFELFQRSV
jgi:NAD(P)-dependent dehydrogenase (short-subunit alcohol dehydrogenase family)